MIRLYYGGEDRETILGVEGRIEVVTVYTGYFLNITSKNVGSDGAKVHTTSSPGLALSMRSQRRMTSRCRGRRPAGTDPGDSCSVIFW
jgi:hypothetical protein